MQNYEALSLDEVAVALGFVPAHDRDTWVRMAMALKSEFGEVAFGLYDQWSSTADNYNRNAVKATWKSAKPGGAVGIGTLVYLAKENGFTFERPEQTPAQKEAQKLEQAQRRIAREQAEREFEAWQATWHQRIAEIARQIFTQHTGPTGSSKYLGTKKCGPHGIGFVREGFIVQVDDTAEAANIITGKAEISAFLSANTGANYAEFKANGGWFIHAKRGTLVVPLRNNAGDILNLQFIFIDKKQFIKNGRKSGLFHLLGSITNTTPALLIAEGYATAATLHEATGYPVVMAMDCGNLLPVAQAWREECPDLPMIFCADNDAETKDNPGKTYAEAAAKAVGGVVALPVFEVEAMRGAA